MMVIFRNRLRIFALLVAFLALASLIPSPAHADVASLQIAPLQYEATLKPGRVSSGYIDVSNPSDTNITITSSVQGFRQVGQDGDLEFYDDPDLSAAIKPGLDNFNLGPREAVRVVFSVDAGKLPQGGIYAVIFFRTTPPDQSSNSSFISESANVGTLLLLENGVGAAHHGQVGKMTAPLWQLGDEISGKLAFTNTDRSARPMGFKPQLSVRVTPWGHRQAADTGLVLPGVTREFNFSRTGAYFGWLPITVTDADTQSHATVWVLACTGWYRWLVAVIGIIGIFLGIRRLRHRPQPTDNDDQAERSTR